jgi:hypothetical protein
MTANRQDIALGAIFIVIGLLFGADVFLGVNLVSGGCLPLVIGTARDMGPGYFPLVLSGLLIVLGLAIAAKGVLRGVAAGPPRPVPWRAIAVLVPLPVFFGLTVSGLGLVPPIFVTAFLAGFASRRATMLSSLLVALGITVFCVVIFYEVARIPNPAIGPWLDFLRFGG